MDQAAKKAYSRQWYEKNKDKVIANTKTWRENNRERSRAQNRIWAKNNPDKLKSRRLKRVYNLTLEGWDQLFESQGSKCAICETTDPGPRKEWHTDHIKGTKVVRGILCQLCNMSLHSRDTPELLRKKANYIEKFQK
jgi:hypothetical protein